MIRAIGFDIKKFDFKRDLLDMDIDDADKEEFEVSFNVEGNVLERFLNKNIRNIKYAYLENKFLFKVLALVLIIFIVYSIFKGTGVNNTILNMNEGFQTEGLTIEVSDSFVTQRDYKLQNITSSLYVIVELNAKAHPMNYIKLFSLYGFELDTLESSNRKLVFKYPNPEYRISVKDVLTRGIIKEKNND